MGNVLPGFDVRFSQETKPEWQWMFYPTIIWLQSSCCSQRTQNERRNRESWFTSSHLLLPPDSIERKQKAKFERKSWKQNNAAVNLELSQEFQSSCGDCLEREGREGLCGSSTSSSNLRMGQVASGERRLSNFVFLANLSSAGSSALASSHWICLHWDYLQYNLASIYFGHIFFIEQ